MSAKNVSSSYRYVIVKVDYPPYGRCYFEDTEHYEDVIYAMQRKAALNTENNNDDIYYTVEVRQA